MIDVMLSRDTVALLGAGMESHAEAQALEAGLALFEARHIAHIWKDQFNIIHAIVGVAGDDYKLQIDLDFFLTSECQCGERFCKHMAAAYYALLAPHENPRQWLQDVTEANKAASSAAERMAADKAEPLVIAAPDAPEPGQWGALLDKELAALYRRQTERSRIDIFYYTAFKKLNALVLRASEEEKAVFRIYCAVKLLLHAEEHLSRTADNYAYAYYHAVISDLYEHFEKLMHEALERAVQLRFSPKAPPCRAALQELLAAHIPPQGQLVFRWAPIHRLLWTQLLDDPAGREEELARLERRLEQADAAGEASSESAAAAAQMAAHLDWLLGRDDAAMAKLARPNVPALPTIVSYLNTHLRTESWIRLERWLKFAFPLLRSAPADSFNRVLAIWRLHAERSGGMQSYIEMLGALLPRSYPQYAECLLRLEQYEEWVNFHLLNGIPLARIERTACRQVEERTPELMIPLYHQSIARLLASRGRASYRESVKLLRRLSELYALAGQAPRFNQFLNALVRRYQRLHAFMEELEKGKLPG